MKKRYITAFAVSIILLSACRKDKATPPIVLPAQKLIETNLNDAEIKQGKPAILLDLNKDGTKDFIVGTLLVGDPIFQLDKLQFIISGSIESNLPVNADEEVPVMNNGETIPVANFNSYMWYQLASVVLMQKITSMDVPVYWLGNWKNATRKYLPVQLVKNGKRFNGWILISADTAGGKLILHSAAIAENPETDIKIP